MTNLNFSDLITVESVLDIEHHVDGLKAVIFDLDDTLFSEKEYVRSGFEKVANMFPDFAGMEDALWTVFTNGGNAIDEVLDDYGALNKENHEKCLEIYRFHKPNIHLYCGAAQMLVRLRKKGLLTGIITDGRPEGQHAKIKSLKIEHLFDNIIITDELGGVRFRKPNDKAFVLMCRKFGVRYEEAVYIGDNINKDFAAPKKLGMKSVLVKNPEGIYSGR